MKGFREGLNNNKFSYGILTLEFLWFLLLATKSSSVSEVLNCMVKGKLTLKCFSETEGKGKLKAFFQKEEIKSKT